MTSPSHSQPAIRQLRPEEITLIHGTVAIYTREKQLKEVWYWYPSGFTVAHCFDPFHALYLSDPLSAEIPTGYEAEPEPRYYCRIDQQLALHKLDQIMAFFFEQYKTSVPSTLVQMPGYVAYHEVPQQLPSKPQAGWIVCTGNYPGDFRGNPSRKK